MSEKWILTFEGLDKIKIRFSDDKGIDQVLESNEKNYLVFVRLCKFLDDSRELIKILDLSKENKRVIILTSNIKTKEDLPRPNGGIT